MADHRPNLVRFGLCLVGLLSGCQSSPPTSRIARFERSFQAGCAELSVGNPTGAKSHLDKAAALQNDHALVHYYLGVCHAMLHEDQQALVGLGRAIRLDPTLAPAYYNIGTIHLRHRRFRQAAEALEKSLELDPDSVCALNNLAKAYYMLALPEMAVEAYERALAIDPDSQIALQALCRLALAGGNPDRAGVYLDKLETLCGESAEVLALRRRAGREPR